MVDIFNPPSPSEIRVKTTHSEVRLNLNQFYAIIKQRYLGISLVGPPGSKKAVHQNINALNYSRKTHFKNRTTAIILRVADPG